MKDRMVGFTLVELLIIIAIIALNAALAAAPVWKSKKKAQQLQWQAERRSEEINEEYMDRDKEKTLNASDRFRKNG